mgnify:CR=1 FL=1
MGNPGQWRCYPEQQEKVKAGGIACSFQAEKVFGKVVVLLDRTIEADPHLSGHCCVVDIRRGLG